MNYLKNTRSVLARLLVRYCKPAARPPPPPPLAPRAKAVIGQLTRGRRWYHDRRKVAAAVLVPGAAAVYYGNLETVPYTNRTHFILLPREIERKLAELDFAREELGPKILPALHPDSIRVRRIASEIVRAVPRSLGAAVRSRDANNADPPRADADVDDDDAGCLAETRRPKQQQQLDSASDDRRHDGVVDWDWEVVVVRHEQVNAECCLGGKIIVYTGLLHRLSTDAEIASVLAHEVGHAVARHKAEAATILIWPVIVLVALEHMHILPLSLSTKLIDFILKLHCPRQRRNETEADYIGILLLGAAGYDPHVALAVHQKYLWVQDAEYYRSYLRTHPPSSKRLQFLSQPKVMEEAMELYAQATYLL